MSYSWFRKGTCTTVNGSDVVRFTGADITTAPNKPVVGDAFTLDGVTLYEVIFIGSDSTGEYVRLEKAFSQAAVSNAKYALMRLASSTQNAKLVAMAAAAINQKQISLDDMYEWYTSTADTVDFLGPDGTVATLKTYFKLTKEISDVGGNTDAITIVSNNIDAVKDVHANMPAVKNVSDNMDEIKQVNLGTVGLSQSHFELIRAQNNEEFAASGFVHLGNHESGKEVSKFKPGLYTSLTTPNKLLLGKADGVGGSKVDNAVIHTAGVKFHLPNEFEIKFPPAQDGTVTYDKSNGEVKKHPDSATAFGYAGIDPTNREVVTDRVDMWGFEAFLEEVTQANPFVYPNGLIQSQATTMEGIATAASARPVTYYAVYDGDTTSKGKGLNFFALSDANKKKVLSNPKHNLYYLDDGRLVQWRLRQRTIAGAGNGDWGVIESTSIFSLGFDVNLARIHTQGAKDAPNGVFGNQIADVFANNPSWGSKSGSFYTGVFVPRNIATNDGIAVNGECYFLVCGTVSRLNQGAYHPSFNPIGTAFVAHDTTPTTNAYYWYGIPDDWIQSKADCFIKKSPRIGYTGVIGNNSQARPDKRFYDAIYADGQGGVCRDMRYSANGLTPVDFDEADLRVKNGTYRGFEKRLFTGLIALSATSTYSATPNQIRINRSDLDLINLVVPDGTYTADGYLTVDGLTARVTSILVNATQIFFNCDTDSVNNGGGRPVSNLVVGYALPGSVGGSFLQTDVIGDPASILQVDALKNGWEGSWIPVIPDGTTKQYFMSRKFLGASLASGRVTYSLDFGASWVNSGFVAFTGTGDLVKNRFAQSALSSNFIGILEYQAFAKQTEPANNEVVYGGVSGVGNVRASSFNGIIDGCLLGESLTGNINKSANFSTVGPDSYIHEIQGLALNVQTGKLVGVNNINSVHSALSIAAPQNNSPAYKALDYNVNINQQGFKQYAATELKHDGTDWGDDGKVTIVDGESTKTDDNGNTVKVVTHKLKEPIGWIKNKV